MQKYFLWQRKSVFHPENYWQLAIEFKRTTVLKLKIQTSVLVLLPYIVPFILSIYRTVASTHSLRCKTGKILALVRNLHTCFTDGISHLSLITPRLACR